MTARRLAGHVENLQYDLFAVTAIGRSVPTDAILPAPRLSSPGTVAKASADMRSYWRGITADRHGCLPLH